MVSKGQKQIDKLLADFLPTKDLPTTPQAQPIDTLLSPSSSSVKPKRKSQAKPTLKQKALVDAYLDKSNPLTYSNGTQSALVAYNIPPDNRNLAGQIAHQTLNSPNVINYLEQQCRDMGIGVEVRLSKLRTFIAGKCTQKTIIRHKVPDKETGKLKLTRTQEIEAPPRIHDRIAAIKELNNMTGFYKQQEIDKQIALSEVNEMYKRIVGKGTGTGNPV